MDIFRILHSKKSTEYRFFSSAYGTISRIDHIKGHKTSLNKFKDIEVISGISSDHNGMKLEINHRKREKNITLRLNNMILRNQCIDYEIEKAI